MCFVEKKHLGLVGLPGGSRAMMYLPWFGAPHFVLPALVMSLAMLVVMSPQLFAHASDAARLFLNSGIFLTAVTAVLLNLPFSSNAETGQWNK